MRSRTRRRSPGCCSTSGSDDGRRSNRATGPFACSWKSPKYGSPDAKTWSPVSPHWPLDDETDEAVRRCLASFPAECERIVVVDDGTGYGRNVDAGLRPATGEHVAVIDNDRRLSGGDVYDLCVPDAVTSPHEDDDLLARLRQAGVPTRQVASVRVEHVGGLTMVEIHEHRTRLGLNRRRFEETWGRLPPPVPAPPGGAECEQCVSLRDRSGCAFY